MSLPYEFFLWWIFITGAALLFIGLTYFIPPEAGIINRAFITSLLIAGLLGLHTLIFNIGNKSEKLTAVDRISPSALNNIGNSNSDFPATLKNTKMIESK